MRAQYLSMLGREHLFEQPARRTCAPLMRDGAVVDPVEEIARRAAAARLVIVNEAHERPQHRDFIARIALRLRVEGFSIYAAETFLPAVREERSWPSLRDGTYSQEPVFGALLRAVRATGYRLIDYEDLSELPERATQQEQIAWREAEQARNIRRILDDNPDARVLVHVGLYHLLEQPDARGNAWMAQRLKQETGIDPLTIDQTVYAAPGDDYVFCDPARTPSPNVDIRIGSPEVTFEYGRPSWRLRAGQRPTPIPVALQRRGENVIVEARLLTEPDDAVPVDRVLIRPTEMMMLMLPPGHYRAESWTQSGGWSAPIEVEAY